MPRTPPSRAVRSLLFAAAALLLPATGLADRAWLEVDHTISGQSNLFRSSSNEQADGSYQIRPRLRFQRPKGEIEYQVEYSPTYDVFFETSGIDGFDQFGRTELSYSPTPLGTFFTSTDLAYYRSIRSNTVEGPSGSPEVVPDVSGRVFRGFTDLGYRHAFSATTVGEASFGIQAYEYSTPSNTDSVGFVGELNLAHQISPTVELGGLLLASHRRFEDQDDQPASDGTILHGGPIVRLEPIPTFTIEVEIGPAWVLTDRDAGESASVSRFRTAGTQAAVFAGCGQAAGQPLLSRCPLAPPGGPSSVFAGESVSVDYVSGGRPLATDNSEPNALGSLLLRKDESWGYASLGYLRAEDASSGNGATTVRDSLTATASFGGDTRWNLRLRANWNQRETVDRIAQSDVVAASSGIPAGGGLFFAEADALVVVDRERNKTTQYWFDATLRRPITRAISIQLEGRYLHQDRSGGGSDQDDFDNWRGGVTLSVEFPHIEYGW